MNRKWLFGCFASAGLVLVPAAGLLAGGDTAGAAAAASAASSGDSGDADGVALPAGVSVEWWGQAQAAIRQLQHPNGDVAGPPPTLLRKWTAEGNEAGANFGMSVGTAGDVNGDGYDDVIVGASEYNNGQNGEGRAFVYHGSASGLSTTANWTAEGDHISAQFGNSVGTAGDVNGDGYDDVIVGAGNAAHGSSQDGAFVYHGSAGGLATAADWTAESNQAEAHFGYSVGTAGDFNGDGYDDVVVGAIYYDNGQIDEGRAFVYFGSAGGLAATPYWTPESDQAGANFGMSVGTAGDVNGDGYDDGIGGAPFFHHGEEYEGMAVVFHGRGTAPPP